MTEYLYRIEAHGQAVDLRRFPIRKRTLCGAWIDLGETHFDGHPRLRFVNLNARKQYANETIGEARQAFLARNKKHIAMLETRVANAKRARGAVEAWDGDVPERGVNSWVGQRASIYDPGLTGFGTLDFNFDL